MKPDPNDLMRDTMINNVLIPVGLQLLHWWWIFALLFLAGVTISLIRRAIDRIPEPPERKP